MIHHKIASEQSTILVNATTIQLPTNATSGNTNGDWTFGCHSSHQLRVVICLQHFKPIIYGDWLNFALVAFSSGQTTVRITGLCGDSNRLAMIESKRLCGSFTTTSATT